MANALETVFAVLSVDAAVTAIVGDRMGPLMRPQSLTLPALTFQRIVTVPQNHLRGNGGLDSNLVQVDAFASTYAAAKALAAVVRTSLETAKHVLSDERDEFDPSVDPDVFRIIQSWQVWTV